MKRKLIPLKRKLILLIATTLIFLSLGIGIPSFILTRNELEDKGNVILSNAVEMVIKEIEIMSNDVSKGTISLEDAQEYVRTRLIGPKNEDGTRVLNTPINLGERGYFIAYNNEGYEVMHPTLEGEYAYNFVTPDNDRILVVQEQLRVGKDGGFVDYSWYFPNSKDIGKKQSYSKYEPNWGWTVVASAYTTDFNKSANRILTIVVTLFIITLSCVMIFSNFFIKKLLRPIYDIIVSMKNDVYDNLVKVEDIGSISEMSELVNGYNTMASSLSNYILKLRKNELEFRRIAFTDDLTKLPNKYSIQNLIERKVLSNTLNGSFVLIDINDLNLINSVYGVPFGDSLIETIAEKLRKLKPSMRSFAARVTGNEFAYWMPNAEGDEFDEWLIQMNNYWKDEVEVNKMQLHVSLRYAYIESVNHMTGLDNILQKANVTMQYAKKNNLDVVKYSEKIQNAFESEAVIKLEAEKGIKNNEFYPVYQEQVSTKYKTVVGVEALARWNSPVLGFVSPGEFIPVLSHNKLIIDFTEKMIESIFNDYAQLINKYGSDIYISINISPLYFLSEQCINSLLENATKFNVKCNNIILEITEDVLMDNQDLVNKKIKNLRHAGFKISLDDFGTGYSSLNYLKNIILDEVKIDKSMIDDIVNNERSRKMLKSLLEVIHSFDLQTVVEGVETEEQVKILKEMKCNIIQGYYYSKPNKLI